MKSAYRSNLPNKRQQYQSVQTERSWPVHLFYQGGDDLASFHSDMTIQIHQLALYFAAGFPMTLP